MRFSRKFRFSDFSVFRKPSTHSKASEDASTKPSSEWLDKRYNACQILEAAGLDFAIWLEDLLVHYDSDTVVFDLNILVHDVNSASTALHQTGYHDTEPDDSFNFMPDAFRGCRLSSDKDPTTITLLSAEAWQFQSKFRAWPPLYDFLDTIMDIWLSIPVSEYGIQLGFALHLFCWLSYCYKLKDFNGMAVNTTEYAEFLRSEHRELHYDIIEEPHPKKISPASTERHFYHVRRVQDILNGNFVPQPYDQKYHQPQLPAIAE
jgi:hypothetical protein